MTILGRVRKRVAGFLTQWVVRLDPDRIAVDRRWYVFGERRRYLLVEKNKYVITHRTAHIPNVGAGSEVIRGNTAAEYDVMWGTQRYLDQYLVVERLAFYRDLTRIAAAFSDQGPVLDVGCGSGHFLAALGDEIPGVQLEGLDFSVAALEQARRVAPRAVFTKGTTDALPFREDVFALVVCIETLEHLREPDAAWQEMFRVCRPGGTVLVTIPNGDVDDYLGHVNFWSVDSFLEHFKPPMLVRHDALEDGRTLLFVMEKPLG